MTPAASLNRIVEVVNVTPEESVRQQTVDQLINAPVFSHRGRHRRGGSDDSTETLLERFVEQIVDVPSASCVNVVVVSAETSTHPTMTLCVPNVLFHVISSQGDFLQGCEALVFRMRRDFRR